MVLLEDFHKNFEKSKRKKNFFCLDKKIFRGLKLFYSSKFSDGPCLKKFLCSLTIICLLKVVATYSTYKLKSKVLA